MKHTSKIQYNFEWTSIKAKKNLNKHKVSFDEAAEVFLDPLHFSIPDDEQPDSDERWITIGLTKSQTLHLVIHTFVSYDGDQITIRLISARKATKHEQKQYEDK